MPYNSIVKQYETMNINAQHLYHYTITNTARVKEELGSKIQTSAKKGLAAAHGILRYLDQEGALLLILAEDTHFPRKITAVKLRPHTRRNSYTWCPFSGPTLTS